MKAIQLGILGLGTVGTGTVNVLLRNADEISGRAGRRIEVKQVAVRDLSKSRDIDAPGLSFTDDPMVVVNDPEIDVIVELIGGETLAKDCVMQAINNGKHVVTANKALIASHGNEIFNAATKAGVVVAFEAAVAGGIPIIKTIRESLAGNKIASLAGIINGTSNYILSTMQQLGSDFADVLADAQAKGYAEADPTFDVGGIDAAHKLTILASIAFGIPLQFSKVYIEGIENLTTEDINYAEELGYTVKHLGIARQSAAGIELRVHPTMMPKQRLLANVNGVMNAVMVVGDAVGDTLFCGPGAGAEPTGSAVVADIVDVVRALTTDPTNRVPHLAFQPEAISDVDIASIDDVVCANYLRLSVVDRPGVMASITQVLGEHNISIESMMQKDASCTADNVSIVVVTQQTREADLNKALDVIAGLDSVSAQISRIRIESLG